tara:strand:+ start:1311 stop:1574 length:264 start_codon:yes stop_codon:yes gene_type:complete
MPSNRFRSHADYIKHKSCDQETLWRSKHPKPGNGYTATSYSVYNNRCDTKTTSSVDDHLCTVDCVPEEKTTLDCDQEASSAISEICA